MLDYRDGARWNLHPGRCLRSAVCRAGGGHGWGLAFLLVQADRRVADDLVIWLCSQIHEVLIASVWAQPAIMEVLSCLYDSVAAKGTEVEIRTHSTLDGEGSLQRFPDYYHPLSCTAYLIYT